MFWYFCGEGKVCLLTKFCSQGFMWLFEASFVEEDIDCFCGFDSTRSEIGKFRFMRLLVHGEKLCFILFVKTDFFLFWKYDQKVLIDCLKLLESKTVLIAFVFLTRLVKKTQTLSNGKKRMPPKFELWPFCVFGWCDNHYTMAPDCIDFKTESVVKWHLLGVFIIAILFVIEKVGFMKIRGWIVKISYKASKWVAFCFWLKNC